ncbi:hypothetical protein M501DRAFT_986928 [Patellaria atrata CBS 101060]|uniref:Uncharacterized protein n=1 Tax=Patellaria atrata CBS 101060 TaxID=1346257 RepID=A0A9P4VMX6_9PEZI|nr:hypothetical protein M501DRAFT_986928 [Patellaria atrata CBS 101060]
MRLHISSKDAADLSKWTAKIVDGHPQRWKIAENLLSLVVDQLQDVQHEFPRSIQVFPRQQGFPIVRFIQEDVEDALARCVQNAICQGETSFLRFQNSPSDEDIAELKHVLTEENVDMKGIKQYRGGKAKVPLLATPFAENLDACLVYLDQAHTRGTDLRLPQNATGALTLALVQTQDHTVQERKRVQTSVGGPMRSESTENIWIRDAVKVFLSKTIQNSEEQTLEGMYGGIGAETTTVTEPSSSTPKVFMSVLSGNLPAVKRNNVSSSALQEVEQEREIEVQVEEEREVQKPIHYTALKFLGVHDVIFTFVQTGKLVGECGYEPASKALSRTSIGQKYAIRSTGSKLFVSVELTRTVEPEGVPNDNFMGRCSDIVVFLHILRTNILQRQVDWVLWNPNNETAPIIIPEEAEFLIPVIRLMRDLKVHLIAYASPVIKSMLHFNRLSYYVLPALPKNRQCPHGSLPNLEYLRAVYTWNFQNVLVKKCLTLAGASDSNAAQDAAAPFGISMKNPSRFMLEWLSVPRKGSVDINAEGSHSAVRGELNHTMDEEEEEEDIDLYDEEELNGKCSTFQLGDEYLSVVLHSTIDRIETDMSNPHEAKQGIQPWSVRPGYSTYQSPYGPKYKTNWNFHGIDARAATRAGITAAAFGATAGVFALFFFAEVPRVRQDIMEKVPILGPYFHHEVPPEDNPF